MFLVSVHCFVNGAVCKVGWVFWGSQVMLCRMFMELSGINAVSAGFTVNSSWPQQQSGAGIRILAGGERSASIGLWQEFVSGNYFCCTAGFLAPIKSRKVLGSPCKGSKVMSAGGRACSSGKHRAGQAAAHLAQLAPQTRLFITN